MPQKHIHLADLFITLCQHNKEYLLRARECQMINCELLNKLNNQIQLEYYSSNLYLQMSAWCYHNGYQGAAKFLKEHAEEEREHMMKLFNYISETGSIPKIQKIDAPKSDWESLKEVFQTTYDHEKEITTNINELVDIALTSKDFSSFNFLQWYVAEQHEEECLFRKILNLFDVIGESGEALFNIDNEIGNLLNK